RRRKASQQPHQRLADANRRAFADIVAQPETFGRKDDDCRAVLEPTQLLAFAVARIAGDDVGAAMAQVEQHVETTQAYCWRQGWRRPRPASPDGRWPRAGCSRWRVRSAEQP